jgi:hypothetical protein
MSWLPPPNAGSPGAGAPPWRPQALGRANTSEFSYLVVEELLRTAVGFAVSPWPYVDKAGRLRFGPEGTRTLTVDRASFERLLAKRRPRSLRRRPLRIGDVFAAKLAPAAQRGQPGPAAEFVQDAATLLRPPLVDVTAEARERAKASFYAADTDRLPPWRADQIRELIEPQPRRLPLSLPRQLRTTLGTPVGAIAALSVLTLAGLGGGTALGRETGGRARTVTIAGATRVITRTTTRAGTVSRTVTRTVTKPTKTVVVTQTTAAVTTETVPRQITLTLTLIGDGIGSVRVDPLGADCSKTDVSEQSCSYPLAAGTAVTLTATVVRGTFSGWGLKDCAKPSCMLTPGTSLALTAGFSLLK